jgi:CheY-like chemotaxis protein
MRQIVRDLRTFSRSGSDEPSVCEVTPVLEVSLRMTQHLVKHRARVVQALEPLPQVGASPARLGQVFVNLLVNSAQAMPPGRDVSLNEIRIDAHADGDRVVIDLRDNGVGMTEDVLRRVFDPFFSTKKGEGTGLGLWVCRNVIHGMGGDIAVESELGVGSVFRLILPAAAAEAPESAAPRAAQQAPGAVPKPRVLVVDDEPRMVIGIRRMLGNDHRVVPFTDARLALASVAAGETFDVAICDLAMPGMSGAELHAELARIAPVLAARTGFVTGGPLSEDVRAFVARLAPDRCLFKPFEVDALRALIRRLLE